MPETGVLSLAFHVESTGDTAETLERQWERIDGVTSVETRALRPARSLDPQSVAATLVIITAMTKAGVTVAHDLEKIIASVKRIANETGITNILVEIKHRKIDINQVGSEDIAALAGENSVRTSES